MPVGEVERVDVHLDDRPWSYFDPIEVLLTIGGRSVLIVAAEIYAERDGPDYYWADGSFFVFAEPDNASTVPWRGARRFVTRQIQPDPHGGDVLDGAKRAIRFVTPAQILNARFPGVCWKSGYDIDDTQRLFDAVFETLESYQFGLAPGASRLTASELRNTTLRHTRFRQGCARPQVDALIRDVAATLDEFERR